MSCRNTVMKEMDAYLAGKSSIAQVKLILANYCPNLKERKEVLKEAKKKIEKHFASLTD